MAAALRAGQAAGPLSSAALRGASLEFVDKAARSVKVRRLVPSRIGNSSYLRVTARKEEDADVIASAAAVATSATATTVAAALLLNAAHAGTAHAVTAEDIEGAISKAQDLLGQASEFSASAFTTGKGVFEQVAAAVKPGLDVALPFLKDTASSLLQAVSPVALDLAAQAQKALQSAGVDIAPVVEVSRTAASVASDAAGEASQLIKGAEPVASSTLEQVLAADPLILAGGAGALILLYLIAPALLSSVAYAARGYAGDFTAAQALDVLSKQDYTLIDVRTEKEKNKSGIPSLPKNAKAKYVVVPIEEFASKLKSQLRNSRKVEAEVAAIKISALKRIGKGSKLIIIDSQGDIGKVVAKALNVLGYKNAWVVADGFDGSKGWVQSRLGTDNYGSNFAEVLSPSRIIPAASNLFSGGTKSSTVEVTAGNRRLLPGGYDE